MPTGASHHSGRGGKLREQQQTGEHADAPSAGHPRSRCRHPRPAGTVRSPCVHDAAPVHGAQPVPDRRCRRRGRAAAGTRDRGSVDQRCTASLGARITRSPASHTAYDAGAPGIEGAGHAVAHAAGAPGTAGRRRRSGARRDRASGGAVVDGGAEHRPGSRAGHRARRNRTRGTSRSTRYAANALSVAARPVPRRCGVHAVRSAPQRVEHGCMLAITPHCGELSRLVRGDATRHARAGGRAHRPPVRRVLRRPRRMPPTAAAMAASPMTWNPAWMPASVQARTCVASSSVLRYAVPWQSGRSAYGAAEPRGVRAERAVDEQVAAECVRTGRGEQGGGVVGGADRLAPVSAHLDTVVDARAVRGSRRAADLGSAAFVHGDDAVRGGVVERGACGPRLVAAAVSRGAGRGAHQVVGCGGERALRVEARRACRARRAAARSAVEAAAECASIRPRYTGRPGATASSSSVGGRGGSGQRGLVPAVAPDHRVVAGARRTPLQQGGAVSRFAAPVRSRPVSGEPVRGDMHVGVDEGRCDERAVEIDDLGVGVQGAPGGPARARRRFRRVTAIAVASGALAL